MSHKSSHNPHKRHDRSGNVTRQTDRSEEKPLILSLVVKGDTDGSEEAVCSSLLANTVPGVPLEILHKGVGDINKNDLLIASGGSRLVVGFNVSVHPGVQEIAHELNIEIRLYSIIYHLQEDVRAIAESLLPKPPQEEILGSAEVIALFKSSRKGIILGCQVEKGRLQLGDRFRVIAAMGPVYDGNIESLHIERDAVKKAAVGQQAGLKIENFKAVKIGDKVESYRVIQTSSRKKWEPSGKVLQI